MPDLLSAGAGNSSAVAGDDFHFGGLGVADFDSSGFDVVDSPSRFVLQPPLPRRLVKDDMDNDNVCFASFSSSIHQNTTMTNMTSTSIIIFQRDEEDLERDNLSMLVCSADY